MLTIEVCGAHERDVDTEIAVDGGAVEAQVDAERHRRPCWVFGAAVEADLVPSALGKPLVGGERTLLAGLDLSFSKILTDSAFVASAMSEVGGQSLDRRSTQAECDLRRRNRRDCRIGSTDVERGNLRC